MERPPKRRWLTYSIRTLLVSVTVFCVWLAWATKWISDRHQAADRSQGVYLDGEAPAPWSLRILGEKGAAFVMINVYAENLRAADKLAKLALHGLGRLAQARKGRHA